jgi:hypothetical protein
MIERRVGKPDGATGRLREYGRRRKKSNNRGRSERPHRNDPGRFDLTGQAWLR